MIPYYRDFLKYDTLLQGLNIIPLLQGDTLLGTKYYTLIWYLITGTF